jgi:large subunit ribosomal protein L24
MSSSSTKKQSKPAVKPVHVKRGDTVIVISGKDKGKKGTVKRVLTHNAKLVVEGVNKVKKAVKPNPAYGVEGGFVEFEAPIPSCKVMLYSHHASKPTRIAYQLDEKTGQKVRICKHTKQPIA